jgi:MoaA/NifB/PqqE/SkfB family radical SAM enzyme
MGEPLAHPNIADMVSQIKSIGSSVELVTNGTLLSKRLSEDLIDAGLDGLWISLDGATPESYKDVGLGAALPEVLNNLVEFRHARWSKYHPVHLDFLLKPHLGIVFVAMKRNIADLPAIFSLASRLGARNPLVTNVLPYTPEMQDEILYAHAINDAIYTSAPLLRYLKFPKMDISATTREAIYQGGSCDSDTEGGCCEPRSFIFRRIRSIVIRDPESQFEARRDGRPNETAMRRVYCQPLSSYPRGFHGSPPPL